jgi:hypothetical protein
MVARKAARSEAIEVGVWGADTMGKSRALMILDSDLWHSSKSRSVPFLWHAEVPVVPSTTKTSGWDRSTTLSGNMCARTERKH